MIKYIQRLDHCNVNPFDAVKKTESEVQAVVDLKLGEYLRLHSCQITYLGESMILSHS